MKRISSLFFALSLGIALGIGTPTLSSAKTGGPFILMDHNNNTVTDKSFRGKYMLMLFGYTFCPDICPTGMQELASVMDLLGDDAKQFQPIFITVDPERDTIEVMRDYVQAFDDRIIGLIGSKSAIASMAKKYRVKFARVEETPGTPGYTMDHGASLILMDPEGNYIRRFGYGTSAEKIVNFLKNELNNRLMNGPSQ